MNSPKANTSRNTRKQQEKRLPSKSRRKTLDAPIGRNDFQNKHLSDKFVSSIVGRFGEAETAFAELLVGFLELGRRLPEQEAIPQATNIHALSINQAKESELAACVFSLAKDLSRVLSIPRKEGLHHLLFRVAKVIEARPPQPLNGKSGPLVLPVADRNRNAAIQIGMTLAMRHQMTGFVGIEWVRNKINQMDHTDQIQQMKNNGAQGDEKTLIQSLRDVWQIQPRKIGRPKKLEK